jgi:hypothetical protein
MPISAMIAGIAASTQTMGFCPSYFSLDAG